MPHWPVRWDYTSRRQGIAATDLAAPPLTCCSPSRRHGAPSSISPAGRAGSSKEAQVSPASSSRVTLTLVDVSGTFVAEVTPGSAEHFNKPGFRQVAVYVETTGGPYFVKVLGPVKTMAKWDASATAFLKSLRFE